ncbi:hypothetical protein ACVWVZ_003159 [Pseudomonas tolaasii]
MNLASLRRIRRCGRVEAVPSDEFGTWRSWVGESKDLDT